MDKKNQKVDLKQFDGATIRFYSAENRRLATLQLGSPAFVPLADVPGAFVTTPIEPKRATGSGTLFKAFITPLGQKGRIIGPFRCGTKDDATAAFRFANLEVRLGELFHLDGITVAPRNTMEEARAQFKAELEKVINPKVKSAATVTRRAKRIKEWDTALDEDFAVVGAVARVLRTIGEGDARKIAEAINVDNDTIVSEDDVVLALNELHQRGIIENADGPTVDSEQSNVD